MTIPLITPSEIAFGLEAYLIIHLAIWLGFRLTKAIGYALYKLLITNHYLQAAFDHGYHQRKRSGHHTDQFVCVDGHCRLISKYS